MLSWSWCLFKHLVWERNPGWEPQGKEAGLQCPLMEKCLLLWAAQCCSLTTAMVPSMSPTYAVWCPHNKEVMFFSHAYLRWAYQVSGIIQSGKNRMAQLLESGKWERPIMLTVTWHLKRSQRGPALDVTVTVVRIAFFVLFCFEHLPWLAPCK